MAKVFIEETTLTNIGNAIRGKEGTTELIPVTEMATRISAIQGGGSGGDSGGIPSQALKLTGDCYYKFYGSGWTWFIEQYGSSITTENLTNVSHMFDTFSGEEIPFTINVNCPTNSSALGYIFSNASNLRVCPKIRGTLPNMPNLSDILAQVRQVPDFEDLFEPSMLDMYREYKVTSAYSAPKPFNFSSCSSLRHFPTWWYKFKLNEESTAFPASSNVPYINMGYGCNSLDELLNIPVWRCQAPATSNMFSGAMNYAYRLKNLTFETDNGQPIVTQWKSQTIELSYGVGHCSGTYQVLDYNNGITKDKLINSDATYQALKDDPDSFTTDEKYSRYNHDSAVNTINSLPDTSVYLATAGGTNTIKFKGNAGSSTDGGAINTLTAEEIAVATAKGWTVTLA